MGLLGGGGSSSTPPANPPAPIEPPVEAATIDPESSKSARAAELKHERIAATQGEKTNKTDDTSLAPERRGIGIKSSGLKVG